MEEKLCATAHNIIAAYRRVLRKRLNLILPPIHLKFDLCNDKPNWAGAASCETAFNGVRAVQRYTINLNMVLLKENAKEMLNQTIPHEIAHIIQFSVYPNKHFTNKNAHGYEWIEVMWAMGINPRACHEFDVTNAIEHHKKFKKKMREEAKKRREAEKAKLKKLMATPSI